MHSISVCQWVLLIYEINQSYFLCNFDVAVNLTHDVV